jgi:hypothetical protein
MGMSADPLAILLAVVCVSGFWLWARIYYRKYFLILLLGLTLRLLAIAVHEKTRAFGDGDIVDFLPFFEMFREAWKTDLIGYLKPHVPTYTVLYAGWIFDALGEDGFWVIRLINAIFGVSVLAPLARINQVIFGTSLTRGQALLIVLWPSWIKHNTDIGRTALSVLLVLLGIAGLLTFISSSQMLRRKNFTHYLYTPIGLILGVLLRTHYIAYFIPILSLASIDLIRKKRMSPYLRLMLYPLAIALAVAIGAGILLAYQSLSQDTYGSSVLDSQDGAVDYAKAGEWGGSVYLEGIYPNTLVDWLWYAPIQGFYFLFSPMPWTIRSAFIAGSALQAMASFILCVRAFPVGKKLWKHNEMFRLLVITLLFGTLAFGSFVKNAGSAERWRLPTILVMLTTTTTMLKLSKDVSRAPVIASSH